VLRFFGVAGALVDPIKEMTSDVIRSGASLYEQLSSAISGGRGAGTGRRFSGSVA